MKRLMIVLMMAALLLTVGSVFAQDNPPFQLESLTFSDGSVLRYPIDYDLVPVDDPDASPDDVQLDARNASFYISLYTADEATELGLETALDAMQSVIDNVDGWDLDATESIEVMTNGVAVRWLRYEDQNFPGTLQAVELPNGSFVVIDAYGAFYNGMYEAVALAMLSDMVLENESFRLDASGVTPVLFDPQPVQVIELDDHTFSDGSVLHYDAVYVLDDDFERRDFVVIDLESATFYVDYFLQADLSELQLVEVEDVMEYSYQPIDENSQPFRPDELEILTLGEVDLYYWRYDDQGSSGTLMAVTVAGGGVLVIDAYNAHPGSIDEDMAVAMALDFVGNAALLNGEPLTTDGLGGTGLGDLDQAPAN